MSLLSRTYLLLCVFILFSHLFAEAQNSKTDSIRKLLSGNIADTTRLNYLMSFIEASNDEKEWLPYNKEASILLEKNEVRKTLGESRFNYFRSQVLNNFGFNFHNKGILDSAVRYYKLAGKLLENSGYNKEAVVIISNLAGIYYSKGEGLPALNEYLRCLKIREQMMDTMGMARSNYNIALCYSMLGQVKKCMEYFYTAIKYFEKLKNEHGKADVLNGIGSLLDDQQNYDGALKYYFESYAIYKKINDVLGLTGSLNNIGKAYAMKEMSDSAIYYYKRVIKIRLEHDLQHGLASAYTNLASEYSTLHNEDLAITYYNKAYKICKLLNIEGILAWSCNGLAWSYLRKKQADVALKYANEGLAIAKAVGSPELMRELHNASYSIYEELKDYYQAHTHFKLYKLYEDSLINISTKEAAMKGQMQYEFDKKELLIKTENEKFNLMQKQEISRQRWVIISVIGGLLITLVFSVFLYSRFKIIRRQKHIIERQKEMVEEKQKEILDSIHYAKRIQQSLLPNDKYISRSLKNGNKV